MPCRYQCIGHRPLDFIQHSSSILSCRLYLPQAVHEARRSHFLLRVFQGRRLAVSTDSACLASLSSLLVDVCPSEFRFLLLICSCTGSSSTYTLDNLSDHAKKTCNLPNVFCVLFSRCIGVKHLYRCCPSI